MRDEAAVLHVRRKNNTNSINALSQNGAIEMPIADQAWDNYYGSFRDKFGVGWMVSYNPPNEQ